LGQPRGSGLASSNTIDSRFCVEALEEALELHGKPRIFNTDQGAQFTSAAFTDQLEKADVVISMDGRGRSWTTFLSNGYGARSSMKRCHLKPTRRRARPWKSRRQPFQLIGERGAGELRALIGVEYARLSMQFQSLLQRLDAEAAIDRVRQTPSRTARLAQSMIATKIQKSPRHRDVGYVSRPHVVRLGDRQSTQQVGVYLVPGKRACSCRGAEPAPRSPSRA